MLGTIIVCPLAALGDVVRERSPGHVVSIASPNASVPALDVRRHTVVVHHDVVDQTTPHPDLIHPAAGHARAIVTAALAWDRAAPLVIHCQFGISRSPAAAMIALAALHPDRDPGEIARALRAAAPFASPNVRLVARADEVLGRDGALLAAARGIGRGTEAATGVPFELAA